MKKSQLVLIVLGLAAVIALYSLPKIVVDNEAGITEVAGTESESTTTPDVAQMHGNELSSDLRSQINSLKATLAEGATIQEQIAAGKSISEIFQSEGIFDSAAFYLDQALSLSPSDLTLTEETGKAFYEAFSFALDKNKVEALAEKTRTYLNRVVENDPSRLDLKSKVAMTYVSSANPMQGITMLREILDQDPQNEDGLFNMGILSMQSGQYNRAVERFEELIKFHPDNLQGQFYLAISYFENKEKNKAKAQFEAVRQMTQDPMILESVRTYLEKL
jgi:outer membrane protein